MMGRKLRCTLDLIHPDLKHKVESKQTSQKTYHDRHATYRNFRVGDSIYTIHFGYGPKWIPGLVQEITGPVSYAESSGDMWIIYSADRRRISLYQWLPILRRRTTQSHSGAPQEMVSPLPNKDLPTMTPATEDSGAVGAPRVEL